MFRRTYLRTVLTLVCAAGSDPLHMNTFHIVKILEQLLQKEFRVMGQISVFHTNQGQPLGQGLSFVVQGEDIDVLKI